MPQSFTQHPDQWAEWLLQRRHGGDPQQAAAVAEHLGRIRDQVLSHADLAAGDVVLDVGTGDGLIAFGALERVGAAGRVVFSDISAALLDHCRARAEQAGGLPQCQFLQLSAEDLAGVEDCSVDVVTCRSVLIYVADKARAFREFFRVLKPGGRLSLFEPINRFHHRAGNNLFWGYDITPVVKIAEKVAAVYRRLHPPETNPMLDFDERDLLAFAQAAGFPEIHLELRVEVVPRTEPRSWEAFARMAPNPRAPTIEEALSESLTPSERKRFIRHLRPLVEAGVGTQQEAVAYLWAIKS